jgi:hypothetical protein
MIKVTKKIGLKETQHANAFLRCLWAQFRSEFDFVSGVYGPRKEGKSQKIIFGTVQLDWKFNIDVGVKYSTKGSIEDICFYEYLYKGKNPPKREVLKVLSRIEECIDSALNAFKAPKTFDCAKILTVNSRHTLHAYKEDRIRLRPIGSSMAELRLKVNGFDALDARRTAGLLVSPIADFLVACTNIDISPGGEPDENDEFPSLQNSDFNIAWAEPDWIDDVQVVDQKLAITKDQLAWLSSYVRGELDNRDALARSSRHFAEAFRLGRIGNFTETSETLLVSALEALLDAVPDPEKCDECGQSKYEVSRRVTDLARAHLGDRGAHQVKQFYNWRSKYLHEGVLRSWHSYTQGFAPQLDPDDPTGCVIPRSFTPNINLLEYTSYIFRARVAAWHRRLAT